MNTDAGHVLVLITASSQEEAAKIAGTLVDEHLAACVNSVHDVHSIYRWQGAVESVRETLLMVKTRASLLAELVESVRKTHSYSVPEIIALPIIGGNPDYLDWLKSETQDH